MDERDRQQLILTLEHDADLRMRSFQKGLDAHYGQCAHKGMFGSGFRIRRAIELIGETVSNFTNHAIDTAQSISKDYESFALVKGNCETMFSTLAARLPSIVWHPDGVPKPNDQSTYDAAKGRMDQICPGSTSKQRMRVRA